MLLTGDKRIRHEQNMTGRKIAVVYRSDNHWPIVKDHVPAIEEAIDHVKPGAFRPVFCGVYRPSHARFVQAATNTRTASSMIPDSTACAATPISSPIKPAFTKRAPMPSSLAGYRFAN